MSFGYLCNTSATFLLKTYWFVDIIVEVRLLYTLQCNGKKKNQKKNLRKPAFRTVSAMQTVSLSRATMLGSPDCTLSFKWCIVYDIYNNLLYIACNTVSAAKYLTMDFTSMRKPSEYSKATQAPRFRHGLNTPLIQECLGARMTNTEEFLGEFVCKNKKPWEDK